ncbi:MAG TPA: ABC-type transport auxiliary lipoprotein family protein [Sedimentisphaerales bacterium]|nr:ABC-type transport auxiliary lipoprotein family protein [Sedimentisphaerales bacterium]
MIRICKPVDARSVTPQVPWMPGLPCLCLFFLGSFAGGCATGSSGEKQQYILEAVRPGEPVQPVVEGSLEVHRFSVDAAFSTRNLVYRLGRFEYETDAYRQFLIAPGTMITEQTRAWLADSGLFQRVLAAGSRIVPDYTLEGNVTALYGDFSTESASAAVMEIRFFLLDNAGGEEKVAFAQTYRAATPVQDRTTEVFVGALNRSLVDILIRLEGDMQREFSAGTVAPTDR